MADFRSAHPNSFAQYSLPKVTLPWNLLTVLLVWALSYNKGWYKCSSSASACGSWLSYNHHGSYHQPLKMRTPSLNYLQNKKPKVPQVPQRDAFSSVLFQTAMKFCAEVRDLQVHNEKSKSWIFLLKHWIARSNCFDSYRTTIPNYMASQWRMIQSCCYFFWVVFTFWGTTCFLKESTASQKASCGL